MTAMTSTDLAPAQKRALLVRLLAERSGPVRTAPLSFAQERLWFLEQLNPGGTAYHLPVVLPLDDDDARAAERALEAIVARHDALRTSFGVVGGVPVQRVANSVRTPFVEVDRRDAAEAGVAVRDALAADNAQPFDLERGPLVRACFVRLPGARAALIVNLHHIVSDGWSCDVLQREFSLVYAAVRAGLTAALAPLPLQYTDYAAWQRERLRGAALANRIGDWKRQLSGIPALLDLPTDRPRPLVETQRGACQSLVVSAELGTRLRDLAKDCGATPFMVLVALFQALLARTAGADDVVVGTPTANRPRADLESLIGFFVNMLALRARPTPDLDARSLIAQVRETALAAFAHAELPFEKLVDELGVRRSLSHSPVFQTAFVLQNTQGAASGVEPPAAHAIGAPAVSTAKFDLTLSLVEHGGGYAGTCEYRTDLFAHATVHTLLRRYVLWLDTACAAPNLALAYYGLGPADAPLPAVAAPDAALADAARHLGLDRDSRLWAVGDDADAQAFAARFAAAATEPATASHVVLTPRDLAALPADAVRADAVLVVIGLPCLDAATARWSRHRLVGVWAPDGEPVARLVFGEYEASLGLPFDGQALAVLAPDGCPQAPGLRGELAWPARPRGGGLRARRRNDGGIDVQGVIARERLIDGQCVDPQRLHDALMQHPVIAQAAVHAQGDGEDVALVAAVVPHPGRKLDHGELMRYVGERLPAGLVPRRLTIGAVLPALPAAGNVRRVEKPRTPIEAVIGRIWAEVLKRPQLDVDANFFDQGGNSLTSVQVISRIRGALHVDLRLHRLFEAPTIAELAQLVEAERGIALDALDADAPEDAPAATPDAIDDGRVRRAPPGARRLRAPLSFAQERLWFLDQFQPGATIYHMALRLPLRGAPDPRVVQRALSELVRRHEALRTSFPSVGGSPQQLIAPPGTLPLPASDVGHLPAAERDAAAARLADADARIPFDLVRGPLLRARYVRHSAQQAEVALCVHHIVFDGWSLDVLARELAVLVDAFAAGESSPLPELPVQYADYARWQRRRTQQAAYAAHLDYWRGALAGMPALLELPTDRPRPSVERHVGAQQWFGVSEAVSDGLHALARREETTLFCVLAAALATLLMRLSGQEDLALGTPVANRTRVELEGLVGFFANTLVVRCDLSGNPTFRELVARTHRVHLAATEHQDVPFERIVEALHPQRALNHNPLFQTMLILQNAIGTDSPLARAAETWLSTRDGDDDPLATLVRGTSKFDLTLTFVETRAGLVGGVEYASDLFDDRTIARWLALLRTLLAAAVAAPDTPVWQLPWLAAAGAALDAGRGATPPGPAPDLLAEIAAQVRRVPHAPAIVDGARVLDYATLDTAANRLAHRLVGLGAAPGRRVAVSLPRGAEALVSVLAVAKTGAAIVTIDPAYPAPRRAFMLDDAAAIAAVVDADAAAAWPSDLPCVALARGTTIAAGEPETPPATLRDDDAALYLLYTSGSTGRPKGVLLPRRSLANLVAWHDRAAPALRGARTAQFSSLSFDVSYQEIFATWCGGGALVVVDDAARSDALALVALLAAQRVERLFLPYVALQQFAEAARDADTLPPLREVVTAGETLRVTPSIVALFERLRDCRLRNQYGPTETHVVTDLVLDGAPAQWPALPPIGRPIDGAAVHVLDRHGQPVPDGVVGELYLGGRGVALGYLERPDLTAERFVRDPWSPGDTRLYRSGDLGYRLGDGTLVFRGRADQQLKVRGFRVEPGEIESALASLPGVEEAVVVAHGEGADGKRLVAYVVGAAGADPARLRSALASQLPDHLVPSAIVAAEAPPLTPSGKIDRAALARQPLPSSRGDADDAPQTPLERLLAAYYGELLGVADVGARQSFFDLGGHSLLATRLLSKIGAGLGLRLGVRTVFEAPSVRALATAVVAAIVARLAETRSEALLARVERRPSAPVPDAAGAAIH